MTCFNDLAAGRKHAVPKDLFGVAKSLGLITKAQIPDMRNRPESTPRQKVHPPGAEGVQ